jgi:hypothetical protein
VSELALASLFSVFAYIFCFEKLDYSLLLIYIKYQGKKQMQAPVVFGLGIMYIKNGLSFF